MPEKRLQKTRNAYVHDGVFRSAEELHAWYRARDEQDQQARLKAIREIDTLRREREIEAQS